MCEQNHPCSNFRGGGQQCTARWMEEETNEALNYVSQIPGHVGEGFFVCFSKWTLDGTLSNMCDRVCVCLLYCVSVSPWTHYFSYFSSRAALQKLRKSLLVSCDCLKTSWLKTIICIWVFHKDWIKKLFLLCHKYVMKPLVSYCHCELCSVKFTQHLLQPLYGRLRTCT